MKKEVSMPLIIAAVVVVAALLGFFAFKAAQPAEVSVPNSAEMKNRMMGSSGQLPAPAAGGGPGGGGAMPGNANRQMQGSGGMGAPPPGPR